MRILYSAIASFAQTLMPLAALFNAKAKLWVNGRVNWRDRLMQWRNEHEGELIWFHCASLGEFEQGRPVIERIRRDFPRYRMLLTFFSPSGYEIRKAYNRVDGVFYLPADTQSNARDFLEIVRPAKVCFVKYEYWPNYMLACEERSIPLVMVSAILRPNQRFFGWVSFFWKPVLQTVDHFFVQDKQSAELLSKLSITRCTIAGDTRFDRVLEVVSSSAAIPELEAWKGSASVLIGGSTWPADEEVLHAWWRGRRQDAASWKLIIVPHEVDEGHIEALQRMWPEAVLWSARNENGWTEAPVLIVDEIGHLSAMYRYGTLAWIGGGFGAGIHTTLEAAAGRLPLVFGRQYE
ncbi:MAG: 3-deoxy-D-manno-octulosonic acid transferase [Flavobacteriales bacterium]